MKTEKPTNIVIKEMERERDTYMKNSTPWRRVNRAIKKLRKLEQIEQIVNNYDGSIPSMIKQFSEIQKVLEQG